MDKLITAFAPAFAAGVALQQFIELISPVFDLFKANKKLIISLFSLAIGLFLSFVGGFRVLVYLGTSNVDFYDAVITGLVISAGTEGFNSIMKFMGYSKDQAKLDAQIQGFTQSEQQSIAEFTNKA